MVPLTKMALSALLLTWGSQQIDAWSPSAFVRQQQQQKQQQPQLAFATHRRLRTTLEVATSTESAATSNQNVDLMLYNSKTRTKERLEPLTPNKVTMYTCGPTVYDFAHVGNFRAFLTYDLVKRALLYFGYNVRHVCNITDVDDKIINRANERSITDITDLTIKFENLFMEDLKALNIIPAELYPRATEHIEEMMKMILQLRDNGLAYETEDGSWYFATDKKEGYGQQLVNINWDEMESTERGENDLKRNENDFCLWKAYKPGIDRDDSSWQSDEIQKGRPGWHLECSAMARKYLGETIDIHCGGVDLKFPHHENEIAQSEGANGQPFCECWLHNGFVNINDEKMSKSLGNFLTLRNACPNNAQVRAYRYLVIASQYRNPLSFTPKAMEAAENALKRIDKVVGQISAALEADVGEPSTESSSGDGDGGDQSVIATQDVPKAIQNFEAALLDDLSMPRASAAMFGLVKLAETEFKRVAKAAKSNEDASLDIAGLEAIQQALQQLDKVFGIFYDVPSTHNGDSSDGDNDGNEDDGVVPDSIMEMVKARVSAKESKDWALADSLRTQVLEEGYAIKDVKGGDPIVSKA